MQEKRTLYLAGKITGDPYYFTKFYNAQKKLEEGGFIVVNPALLPAISIHALAKRATANLYNDYLYFEAKYHISDIFPL